SLVIGTPTTTGSSWFSVSDASDCSTPLTNGQSCEIEVTFTANSAADEKNGTLRVPSNATNGTVTATLKGEAVAAPPAPQAIIKLTPGGYNFGDVVAGSGSKDKAFTIANTGDADLEDLDFGLTGPAAFSILSDTCDATLGDGETCQVTVRFAPGTTGSKSATLTVTASNASSKSSNLTGVGITGGGGPNEPIAKVTPDEWDFGNEVVDGNHGKEFTLKNVGSAPLTGIAISTTGNSFSLVTSHPSYTCDDIVSDTLAPGDECVIRVRFQPPSQGAKTGKLKVASNATNGTVNVPLEGNGVPAPSDVVVSPNPFDYGSVAFGTTKNRKFTVTNNGGSPATVQNIAPTSGNTGRFTVLAADDDCTGVNLAAGGGSCEFIIQYKATANANSHNAVFTLSGTGFPNTPLQLAAQSSPRIDKIDGRISSNGDVSANYVGAGVFCATPCDAQTVSKDVQKGKTFNYRVRIQNAGNGKDGIRVQLTQSGSKAIVQSIKVLRNGNQDVTTQVTNGTYVVNNVNPGSNIYFWVQIKLKANAPVGKVNQIIVTGTSTSTTSIKDVLRAKTKAIN
ncbi:MAG: choice-of-anchor D domain-containing protein, partial [Chloroflexi bacterium]|nr:choice-of-anchor D domain-containing protein [Chloroflexota bacterium]